MIRGVGIDLVDIDRMEKTLLKWGGRFLNRVFREGEIDYCEGHNRPARHFAARFAAKEAFLKGVGVGLFSGIGLKDVEVTVIKGGKPELRLHGKALELAEEMGVVAVHVSLSHTDRLATAFVVLEMENRTV